MTGGGGGAGSIISVVLPFRDPGEMLPRALRQLDALREVAGDRLEVVLVDDGSQGRPGDGSGETADAWAAGRGNVITVTVAKSGVTTGAAAGGGVAAARDAGILAAHGDFIWMVDCDDRILPEIIGAVLRVLDAADVADAAATVDMVCFRASIVEPGGRTRRVDGAPGRRLRTLDRSHLAVALLDGTVRGYLWSKVIRRSVLLRILGDYPHTTSQSDFMTVLSCVPLLGRTVLLPQTGYRYLQREGSISTTDTRQVANTARCADLALKVLPPLVPGRLRRRILRASFRVWFHIVPCCATPVHQGWPEDRVWDVHRTLGPMTGVRGIVGAAVTGHLREAAHALVFSILGPLGWYPPVYRAGRTALSRMSQLSRLGRRWRP